MDQVLPTSKASKLTRIIHEGIVFCSGGGFLDLGCIARIRRRRPVGRPAGDLGLGWVRFRGCRGACVRQLSLGRGLEEKLEKPLSRAGCRQCDDDPGILLDDGGGQLDEMQPQRVELGATPR